MNAPALPPPTRVRCLRCSATHDAAYEVDQGRVFGRVDCPVQAERVHLSSNAELYLALRNKSRCLGVSSSAPKRILVHLLPVTDACNFNCPVCYASCGSKASPAHLPVAEAAQRARRARNNGARTICITGGEPTMHPDLLHVVRAVKATGARPFLITNGYRLGTEPGLAEQLRAAGLDKVDLQFDTLDPRVHRQLRGNEFIPEKVEAARNTLRAGIRLGTVTTVTRLNLGDVENLLSFALSMGPGLKTVMFQTAAPVGRFELSRELLVDKEEILNQVLASKALPDPTLEDVWPFPRVEPWGIRVHPDCGVSLVWLRDRQGRLHRAGEWLDLPRLHRELNELGAHRHWWARNMAPLRCLLRSSRPGYRLPILRNISGFMGGVQKTSALLIGISSFCSPHFIDEARLAGCATAELRPDGPVSPCACYLR